MKSEYSPYIAIQVQDYDKAIKFYQEVLGMELTEIKGSDTYMKKGIMNFVFENGGKAGTVFFEFKVDDVQKARQELEANGCKVTQVYSESNMMISDPFGMNFHIWQDGADL